jgi:hypothetical protein
VNHRILCIEKENGQIVAVGTGGADGADGVANRRWTPAEVRRALAEGDRFYVISPNTGSEADLELRDGTIAGARDDIGQECLNRLRSCRWR